MNLNFLMVSKTVFFDGFHEVSQRNHRDSQMYKKTISIIHKPTFMQILLSIHRVILVF